MDNSESMSTPAFLRAQPSHKGKRILGAFLRRRREAKGLTQSDVARHMGRSKQWVVRSESGQREVSVAELLVFLKLYDSDPGDFLREVREALPPPGA